MKLFFYKNTQKLLWEGSGRGSGGSGGSRGGQDGQSSKSDTPLS